MKQRSDEARTRQKAKGRATRAASLQPNSELSLKAMRRARSMTQQQLSNALDIGQDSVSRLERRSDLRISTLRAYVEALGGRLTLLAEFPEQPSVVITGFERPK